MNLRTDYDAREHVPFESISWAESPTAGVERKMLERDGDEVARATSIVRYEPGRAFAEHVHEWGEEFLVLEGTFQDEHGDYPAGTYVRNPPGSSHRPFATRGCTIFVKLRQFVAGDSFRLVAREENSVWAADSRAAIRTLYAYGSEQVSFVELAAQSSLALPACVTGTEILVLRGAMDFDGAPCQPLTWLRSPGAVAQAQSEVGCLFWMKRGHLPPSRVTA